MKEKNLDLLVETFATTPKGDVDTLKSMSAAEREKFFKEYVQERCKDEKLNGVYVFVCKNPAFLYVDLHGPAAPKFPSGFAPATSKIMLAAFKEKKFDDGLNDALTKILETTGVEKAKEKEKK